ncbi:MAG: DUF4013 domain-containing protein [Methanobacteriaceae archaeon]|jgi:hypothetical protein|nr:DUF4013 domain-containing protein [Methanobacteriaceae archaeon]MDO9628140.1 DUF4013 domain-containing protein [Methanobacteriaceae archaeon]
MRSKEIIKDSLIYPFLDLKKTLTIFILFLTSFLIIPGIMACGYLLQLIGKTTQGSKELWAYDTKRNLLLDGAKFLGMFLIFGTIFYGILWALEKLLINFTTLNSPETYIITAVFTIAFNMFFVMSLAHMAHEKRFISAFNIKKIFNLIKKVGIKKYTFLLVIFTLVAEFINEVPIGIMKNLISFNGIWGNISFILFSLVILSYIIIFASRFTGLIYPENKTNN